MEPSSNAIIITVANQKGGVGKTTSVMNLGVAFHQCGKKVLLIDSDPQANLTSYLGVQPTRTLDEIYLSKRPMNSEPLEVKKQWICPTHSGVDLIASDRGLSGVEYYLFSRSDKEMVLKGFLECFRDAYDFILIDTPPSLNLLTLNALCASDRVLIPVQPEFFSLEGIVKIRETIGEVKARWNPSLAILGILATQVSSRRKLTDEILSTLRAELGSDLLKAMIRDSAAVTESSGHAKSVLEYQRSSNGAQDYIEAAAELIKRCASPKRNSKEKQKELSI